jgi:hypothetical protein
MGGNPGERDAQRLIRNGLAVMIVALLAGFVLVFSMVGAISFSPLPVFIPMEMPGSAQGWRAVHVGSMLNGVMAVVVGLAMRRFALSDRAAAIVSWGAIIAIWANVSFYVFGMFAPDHGVTLQSNRLGAANLSGVIAFIPAFVGAVTLIVALSVLLLAKPARPLADQRLGGTP